MNVALPPLNALRAFEAAARHLSFRKAAQELHVTPAAISHQLKALEDYLGVKLFRRANRRVELTPAARAAAPRLHEGFASIFEAVERLREGEAANVLTVSAAPSFAAKWLMPRLHRFVSTHPEIDVRLSARMRSSSSIGRGQAVRSGINDVSLDDADHVGIWHHVLRVSGLAAPLARARSCRTSSSIVCEKSAYQRPTALNGSGVNGQTTSSATSRRA